PLCFPFSGHGVIAGTLVAIVAAVIGWFMLLRGEAFAGHTFAVVGFPGAAGAALIGISAWYGALTFCLATALVLALLPHRDGRSLSENSAVTGLVQAFA